MSSRQSSITPFGRTVICLPLVKFSFATVTAHMTSVPWTHIHSEELFVLLEHIGAIDDHDLQLKVVQGSATLERIPLSTLVRAAVKIKEAHEETSGHFTKIEHLPIFAMTKENAIAIRYNLPSNESRRTQMNFDSDVHRKELLTMLQDMGMVITGAKQKPLPSSSQTHNPAISVPSYDRSSATPTPTLHHPRSRSEPQYRSQAGIDSYPRTEPPSDGLHRDTGTVPCFGSKSHSLHEGHSSSQHSVHGPCASGDQDIASLAHSSHNTISAFDTPMRDAISETPVTLQDLLPPRRELPFSRPSSRSSVPASELPPLPKPSFVGLQPKAKEPESRAREFQPRFTSRGISRTDVSSPPVYFERPTNSLSSSPIGLSSLGRDSERVRADAMSSPSSQQSPSCNDNYSLSTGLSSPDHNGAHTSSALYVPLSVDRPVFAPRASGTSYHTADQKPSPQASWTPVDTLVSNPHFQTHLHGDTQAHAAESRPPSDPRMTPEERRTEFDNWLCGRLEDPQFAQLCVDMEAAWRFRTMSEHVREAQ